MENDRPIKGSMESYIIIHALKCHCLKFLSGNVFSRFLGMNIWKFWLFSLSSARDRIIKDETLIEEDIWRFLSIVFALEQTNQLNLLSDKDLVDLCHPIEPYQVTKNPQELHYRCWKA